MKRSLMSMVSSSEQPVNVKRQIIRQRGYVHLELEHEDVAEFEYKPTACHHGYRMVVVRKNISKEQGESVLFDEIRYLFYISNDDKSVTAEQIVFHCNKRCDQENLIAQLKSGVRSLCAPTDNLLSNGAYMLMTSLAWTLKAWSALLLPISPRHRSKHEAERTRLLTMEYRTFLDLMIHVPCQIIRHARKTVYRLLNWTEMTPAFFRMCDSLQVWPQAVDLEADRHKSRRSGRLRQPVPRQKPHDRNDTKCKTTNLTQTSR